MFGILGRIRIVPHLMLMVLSITYSAYIQIHFGRARKLWDAESGNQAAD